MSEWDDIAKFCDLQDSENAPDRLIYYLNRLEDLQRETFQKLCIAEDRLIEAFELIQRTKYEIRQDY